MMQSIRRTRIATDGAVVATRILVVDSEPLIRWSICTALSIEGFDAVAAADPLEACRLAAEWPPPRVVLFDERAPDHGSLELLSDIRQVYPDCRFIIMTTARECSLRYASGDAVELIQKPFDLTQLVELVKELASRSRLAGALPRATEQTGDLLIPLRLGDGGSRRG
jgi:DNA-binding NtrC family response regulator